METNNGEVRCDYCGCAFKPELITEMDGDIAYSFFRCDYCGKAFMAFVTDPELRNGIYEYSVLAARSEISKLPDEELEQMRKLKIANKRRADELRKLYLREDADEGKQDDRPE